MCLAVPMQIQTLDSEARGTVDLDGVNHAVDLSLIDSPAIGDYVLVHAGFAIERLDPDEADERLALFEEIAHAWSAQTEPED